MLDLDDEVYLPTLLEYLNLSKYALRRYGWVEPCPPCVLNADKLGSLNFNFKEVPLAELKDKQFKLFPPCLVPFVSAFSYAKGPGLADRAYDIKT